MSASRVADYTWRYRTDPDEGAAYWWLAIREAYDREWRRVRRRASMFLALFVPVLAGLLAASLPFLIRTELKGWKEVMTVAVLGGLVGGVFLCVGRLARLVSASGRPPDRNEWPSPDRVILTALAKGILGGAYGGFFLLFILNRDSYRPQTVYLISVVGALVLARWLTTSTRGTVR